MAPRIQAPELTGVNDWFNVDAPLSLGRLKGKLTLLFFWTSSSASCEHTLEDLKALAEVYGSRLAIITVHCPKFEYEKSSAAVRSAVLRLAVDFPTVNDPAFKLWRSYGVIGWPTVAIIDSEGDLRSKVTGEGKRAPLEQAIVEEFKQRRGSLNSTALPVVPESDKYFNAGLAFPHKLMADAAGKRLYISDTAHHRLLVVSFDGATLMTIGSGEQGADDGPFSRVRFNRPQGLALNGTALFVADSGNHLIRRIDLAQQHVTTVCGTGYHTFDRAGGSRGTLQGLNSPLDLTFLRDILYIAMAGSHQLWSYDPATGLTQSVVGSGLEERQDGAIGMAALAQPAGIDTDGEKLFFVDSQSSSARSASLGQSGQVHTMIGAGLFDFGDQDGHFKSARLQHCCGIAAGRGRLYVADTFNHKIKEISPLEGQVRTLAGTGAAGFSDGLGTQAELTEPRGLSYSSGNLFICDTGNHAIRILELMSGHLKTLILEPPAARSRKPRIAKTETARPQVQELASQSTRAGADITVTVRTLLPEGFEFGTQAPSELKLFFEELPDQVYEFALRADHFACSLPVPSRGTVVLKAALTIYYRRTDRRNVCQSLISVFKQPLSIVNSGTAAQIKFEVMVKPEA